MIKNFGFDDIVLVPRVISSISSRDNIKIRVKLLKDTIITSPIVASPMQDVCNGDLANKMKKLGGIGVIHRFFSPENQLLEFMKTERYGNIGLVACAIGVDGDATKRFDLLYAAGCQVFCIDTANGANKKVESIINSFSGTTAKFIVGNVSTKQCYEWVQSISPNIIAIRVGQAGGSSCTTKNATGINYGIISSICECAEVKKDTLLIADGGIREPSDFCKSIACGADLVMLGSTIAATSDSPAEIIEKDHKPYKIYHGSASFEIQKKYREKPKYIEGRTRLLEFNNESIEDLVIRYCEGLRSSMSYFNSQSIQEFQQNVSFAYNKW